MKVEIAAEKIHTIFDGLHPIKYEEILTLLVTFDWMTPI